jgi:hypothetical protein
MVGLLSDASAKENIDIHCDVSVTGIQRRGRGFAVSTKDGRQFNVDLVVHGAGRAPDIDSLDLERAGIDYSSSGITVDVHMRTTNAALYWPARMLEAGEDALYVARRMVRFASEDVGNAGPFALRIALGPWNPFDSWGTRKATWPWRRRRFNWPQHPRATVSTKPGMQPGNWLRRRAPCRFRCISATRPRS